MLETYFRFNTWLDVPLGPLQLTKAELEENDGGDSTAMTIPIYKPHLHSTMYRNEDSMREDALNEVRKASSATKAQNAKLEEEDLLICKHLIRGYSLKVKKWLDFDVTLVKDIKWNTEAFDSLALPGDYKYLLLAFTKSQATSSDQFDDVIEGKGKGMVMLLEGPPGVGKTLTVESGSYLPFS
jgi:flagellar biosynthesis GTPase FlhF